jgi:phthiodiolone/phenolphthiodiolone dimycocerosates ketoreductase
MRDIKYGENPPQFPPFTSNRTAVQAFEEVGMDFVCYWDQHCLTIPRTIWTPDIVPVSEYYHIDAWFEPWPQMTDAALATNRVGIGLTVSDAVRRHPSILAQLGATLDHYSEGRFFLGLGAGEEKQAGPYGITRDKPFARLEEQLKLIRKFWSTFDPIDFDGEFYKVKQASVGAAPFTPGGPKMIVAGGPGRAMRAAANLADGWMTYAPNGTLNPEQYAQQVEEFNGLVRAAGKNPDEMIRLVAFCVLISDDDDEMEFIVNNPIIKWDVAAIVPSGEGWRHYGQTNPLGDDFVYSRDLLPLEWSREDALKICNQVTPDMVRNLRLCGTPEEVADMVQPYIEAGATHIVLGDYSGVVTTPDFFGGAANRHARFFNRLRKYNDQPIPTAVEVPAVGQPG